jgi:hypothetical protein
LVYHQCYAYRQKNKGDQPCDILGTFLELKLCRLTVGNTDDDHKGLCSDRPLYPQEELYIILEAVVAQNGGLKGDFEVPVSSC